MKLRPMSSRSSSPSASSASSVPAPALAMPSPAPSPADDDDDAIVNRSQLDAILATMAQQQAMISALMSQSVPSAPSAPSPAPAPKATKAKTAAKAKPKAYALAVSEYANRAGTRYPAVQLTADGDLVHGFFVRADSAGPWSAIVSLLGNPAVVADAERQIRAVLARMAK